MWYRSRPTGSQQWRLRMGEDKRQSTSQERSRGTCSRGIDFGKIAVGGEEKIGRPGHLHDRRAHERGCRARVKPLPLLPSPKEEKYFAAPHGSPPNDACLGYRWQVNGAQSLRLARLRNFEVRGCPAARRWQTGPGLSFPSSNDKARPSISSESWHKPARHKYCSVRADPSADRKAPIDRFY